MKYARLGLGFVVAFVFVVYAAAPIVAELVGALR